MRCFADGDELDLLVVGCGAAGRYCCSAWPGRLEGRGPRSGRSGTRTRLGQRRSGRIPVLDQPGDLRVRSGAARLEQLRPRRRIMVHYAATPRFHPSDFRILTQDGSRGLPSTTRPAQLLQEIEENSPSRGEMPWRSAFVPLPPHPVGGNGELFLRGADKLASPRRSAGRHRQRASATGTASTAASAARLQVKRQSSPLITHIPTRSPRRRGPPDCMVTRSRSTSDGRHRVHYVRDGCPVPEGRMVAIAGYSIETPRLLLELPPSAFRRVVQRLRPGRRYLM